MHNMTFARLILTATANDALPEFHEFNLPPRPTAHNIIQFYMTNVFSLFPFFSETALLTILNDVYQQDGRFIKNSDYFLFYMVLAIGSSAQCQVLGDNYYADGVQFVSKALEYADSALAPGFVVQIQSLLLLTQYSMVDPAHFDSWHLIGFTARAVVDLGLHQDPPSSSAYEKNALDMRRKMFYCVYSLDRYATLYHPRLQPTG